MNNESNIYFKGKGISKCFVMFAFFSILSACSLGCDRPSAAVLPYSVIDGHKVKVLLAYDNRGFWSSLAGGTEFVSSVNNPKRRCETPQETAVREAWEESRHLLPETLLVSGVSLGNTIPVEPTEKEFVTYAFQIDDISLTPFYENIIVEGSASDETSELSWFFLDDLIMFANGETEIFQTPNNRPLRPIFLKQFKAFIRDSDVNRVFVH